MTSAVIFDSLAFKEAQRWDWQHAAPGWRRWYDVLEAEAGGQVVGFASCGAARYRLENLEAEVYALYVLQDHQRPGIGAAAAGGFRRPFRPRGLFGLPLGGTKGQPARALPPTYSAKGGGRLARPVAVRNPF